MAYRIALTAEFVRDLENTQPNPMLSRKLWRIGDEYFISSAVTEPNGNESVMIYRSTPTGLDLGGDSVLYREGTLDHDLAVAEYAESLVVEIQTLNEFRPSQFDRPIADEDLGEWLVCPVVQTRDSGVMERCNFEAMARILDDAGAEYTTIRRGHWGPGWVEILVCAPTEANARLIVETSNVLSDYPILDDDRHSEMEYEDAYEQWEHWGRAELARKLEREHGISDAAFDLIRAYAPLPEYEHSGDNDIAIEDLRIEWERDAVAELIWECRGYASEE